MKTHKTQFGLEMRRYRLSKNIPLREAARYLKISPTYLHRVEMGEIPTMTSRLIIKAAQAYGASSARWLRLAARCPLCGHKINQKRMRQGAK